MWKLKLTDYYGNGTNRLAALAGLKIPKERTLTWVASGPPARGKKKET